MGFKSGAYATCWSVEAGKGNFTKVRLSTSRKMPDGTYEQDFSGYCMFIGNARAKAERLREKDRIRIGDIEVTTTYNKAQGKEYVNYKVFDFEPATPYQGSNDQRQMSGQPAPDEASEDLPF